MITNEERIIIERIAEDYGFKYESVVKYLNILKEYPFVINGEQEKMYECLEEIVSDRATVKEYKGKSRPLNETISEYLYRYYPNEALFYLNEEFLNSRGIDIKPEYEGYENDIRPEEYIEKGYSRKQ